MGARIGVARNVTALAKAEEELRFLAHHDPLTKLTNRSLFNDRLISALRTAQRQGNELALLFLDINDFKSINDLHGHAAGDRVLCIVAQRLKSCVREIDTVARIGGDEFTVLLTDVTSRDAISQRLDQIHQVMSEPLPPNLPHSRCHCAVSALPIIRSTERMPIHCSLILIVKCIV
ncbi:GGDEF domain-containing protein [Pseudomonas sp. A4]|nr:GGDEF domain-containing protein [Pseudomonas sp. S11A4]